MENYLKFNVESSGKIVKLPNKSKSVAARTNKGVNLALLKRHRPIPGVGHYDDINGDYLKVVYPRSKALCSLSTDKIPKMGFVPSQLSPDPDPTTNNLQTRKDYFRWSQAGTNKNFDISKIIERDKVSFIKTQAAKQKLLDSEKKKTK